MGAICRKHGILLIADEVQTGFARTGAMFACERLGLEPDLVTMAKSLTGGLPMAGVTGRAEIMDAPGVGQLGGTFAGNPAACEAALAVLDIIEKENLCARANVLGERFRRRATKWQERWELVGDVRGLGAMQALELVRSKTYPPARGHGNHASVTVLLRAWPGHDHGWIVQQRDSLAHAAGHH